MTMTTTSSDMERAIQNLRAKHQEYYVQWVKDAIESEAQRKSKLEKTISKDECRRLERQFEKERLRDKERMQQIQEDHALILKAKVAEWTAHGVPETALVVSSSVTARTAALESDSVTPTDIEKKAKPKAKVTKATLERLSTPIAAVTLKPDDTQDMAFHEDVIRKENKVRLQRYQPKPSASGVDNLKTLTETDLLHRKMNLLTQLHGVVSHQERIVQDDQWTVRSSVSSWKSVDFQSTKSSSR